MDILGLEAFVRIAECGSFSRAATTMNLSQTALSHRIKKLERDIGLSLFQRTTRTLTLTRAGEDLYPKARDMISRLNALHEELRIGGRRDRERVAVGCLSSLGERFLPNALWAFRERCPAVDVVIHDERATMLSERVAAGEVDFALTILGAQHWAQQSRALYDEEFVAAVPADHPLAGRGELKWADLVGYPLARVSATTSHGLILTKSLDAFAHELDWRYEVQRTHMAAALVIAELAITVLPRAAIPEHERVRVIPITAPVIKRTVGIISLSGVPLSAPALELQRMLLAEIARQSAGSTPSRQGSRAAAPSVRESA